MKSKLSVQQIKRLEDKKLAARAKMNELIPMIKALREELNKWETHFSRAFTKFHDADEILGLAKMAVIPIGKSSKEIKIFREIDIDSMTHDEATQLIKKLERQLS